MTLLELCSVYFSSTGRSILTGLRYVYKGDERGEDGGNISRYTDRGGRVVTQLFITGSCSSLFLLLFFSVGVAAPAGMEITPFSTFEQGPLVQIYGLPRDTGSDIVPPETFRIALNQDHTNNCSISDTGREQITLDGEMYRLAVVVRYGVSPRWEAGIEIPYLSQGKGFLDSQIDNWHKTIGLHQSSRDNAPKNNLNYSYVKDGIRKLWMDRTASGIGDISLMGGFSLYDVHDSKRHDGVALKAALKLPTGESSSLLGSGSTDFSLQFCGSMNSYTERGSLGVYGSVGALVMSGGEVLSDQHNPLAGLGTLGFGWGPSSWLSLKIQLNGHTPLYHDSTLDELSKGSLLLISGGRVRLPQEYMLDIAIAENLSNGTAPDVSFHLGLTKQF